MTGIACDNGATLTGRKICLQKLQCAIRFSSNYVAPHKTIELHSCIN